MERARQRLGGLLFLAVVAGAIVLLILGYGVPVGLGALAGLILGTLAGALGVLWLGRGHGRAISFGGAEWSSDLMTTASPDARMAEMEELAEVMVVDLGALDRLVPVLATVEEAALVVTLVAIEWREAGLVCWLEAGTRPGGSMPASTVRVSVEDDVDTSYRAAGQGGGGRYGVARYEVTITPRPPASARRLTLRVDRFFDMFPGSNREQVGPWAFVVELRSPDPA